ncbi:hypothetical protein CR5_131 [Cronobacter phage CR5]|uniref:Uncharacterized protein n=1 Tax=Salmonella muenchen TaxID=596 RepID=A0A5U8XKE0_SALMU|nr:hypothetical protein CR5_131 [Cronobacter phage CR5]EBS0563286.1 hypothetical protein [Salmonella enterica subsp. enterica serovar Muenchen]EBZ2963287.1 hypothetical protein [Salmonella enterica subsp. enterica serovar Enteritidis]ECG1798601.1 hypothetical protein [Salmonella enterica subsp. enterica serovar Paratyphi B]ECG3269068.1 hypothetical protein [Salmonella enterica subsp. enterica serovar Infantis]AFO71351.1 hypothetical protein CR5_131 [Cronobacter phage CR5]
MFSRLFWCIVQRVNKRNAELMKRNNDLTAMLNSEKLAHVQTKDEVLGLKEIIARHEVGMADLVRKLDNV